MKGMIPGKMPMQGTMDPASQLIKKNGGKQPPRKNKTAAPKQNALPPMMPMKMKGKKGR